MENKKIQASETNFKFVIGFWKPKDILGHFRSPEDFFFFLKLCNNPALMVDS